MDEYVGGISANYMTNSHAARAADSSCWAMLKEDMSRMGAEDLHQLQRAWELHHRLLASESVTHHTLFRKETRWPGYYYRGDHMKLDDENWHCFTLSRYDRNTGKWDDGEGAGLPHHRLIVFPVCAPWTVLNIRTALLRDLAAALPGGPRASNCGSRFARRRKR